MSSRTRTKRPTLNLNLNLNLPIADIHDILPEYGFPKGIIPNAVKSYSLSSVDGSFEIELEQPCYVQFDKDELIYYDKNIKGVLRIFPIVSTRLPHILLPLIQSEVGTPWSEALHQLLQ
ncbi:hypothetical protein CsSME_00042459 [Camellia sinensis var. sinensis]